MAQAANAGAQLKRTYSPSVKGHDRRPRHKKQKVQPAKARSEGTHEEVLAHELRALSLMSESSGANTKPLDLPEPLSTTLEVTVTHLSSTGDGIAVHADYPSHAFVVPFTLPGDTVRAKVVRHVRPHSPDDPSTHTVCDLVSVLKPSPDRHDDLVQCRYFSSCSGCQFQMAEYDYQLQHKRRIVENAYRYFSHLPASQIPPVGDTIASPLQYGYRTKLTPHFDGPPNARRAGRKGQIARFETVPEIGFMKKGTRRTLDIEECPIGTQSVQIGLKRERKRVVEELDKYRRGATILLRQTTERIRQPEGASVDQEGAAAPTDETAVVEQRDGFVDVQTCTSANNSTTTEYVDDFVFKNPANAFFQNNNSILSIFTQYIRNQLSPSDGESPTRTQLKNLIDAYSGSGLFTITLSGLFKNSIGIDISAESIEYARKNAKLNGVLSSSSQSPGPDSSPTGEQRNVQFLASTAHHIFASVPSTFLPEETVVVIDPPRKGCDEDFLRQLIKFAPERIVYVSCNVHTQARDVGWILQNARVGDTSAKTEAQTEGAEAALDFNDPLFEIESVRGFDFFPQTGHVEGVAVLRRRAGKGPL